MAVRFAIDGDVRFISHRDTVRLFARALKRADLPVRYSEGFNPHPKVLLPLPRPVGMASETELLIVEFTDSLPPDEVLTKLRDQVPAGITVLDAHWRDTTRVPQPEWVTCELPVDAEEATALRPKAQQLLEADAIPVIRESGPGKPTKDIDIRRFILDIEVLPDRIRFRLAHYPDGAARPAELIAALGMDPIRHGHRLRRVDVRWQDG